MLNAFRDLIIASVRRRVAQGDCPTEPVQSVEILENVVIELADELERLRGMGEEA